MKRIISLLVMSTVIGCAGSQDRDGGAAFSIDTIAGIKWQLVRLEMDNEEIRLLESSLVSFACTPSGEVSGLASINRYSGSIVTAGSRIDRWNPLRVTRMAGPPELMKQESQYLAALSKTTRMSKFGRKLILEDSRAGIRLEFVEPAD